MGPFGRLIREPLLHFALLGVALFAWHRAVAPPAAADAIVVSAAVQRGFQQEHLRRHGRLPTAEELTALVERYVDTEVMLREAVALGLDRGDIIVRRRLVQKMEYVNASLEPHAAPSDAELEAYLVRHAERYMIASRLTLEHVFVSSRLHPTDAASVAADLRERLAAGADPAGLGDPFLRGRVFRAQSEGELGGVFGPAFAHAVVALPPDEWAGPIASSFGLHLVRVTEPTGGRRAAVDEVRSVLVRDVEAEERAESGRKALAELRARYAVRIEPTP